MQFIMSSFQLCHAAIICLTGLPHRGRASLASELGWYLEFFHGAKVDYFDVADTVIMMKDYLPEDVSEQAREIANTHPSNRAETTIKPFNKVTDRAPIAKGFDASRGHRDVNVAVKSRDMLMYGETPLELRGVEQVVDPSQTRAIGYAIHMASKRWMDGELPLNELLNEIETFFDNCGLEPLAPFRRGENHPGNLARPRRYEIAAAINRLRTAKCKLIRN